MFSERVYNFAAGPSVLPQSVLEKAAAEMLNYRGSGMSVMEMSHRSAAFSDIFYSAKAKLKAVLNVPDNYEILFLQGGATTQFASIPMNLIRGAGADYAVTGNFAKKAAKEAEKYGTVHCAFSSGPDFLRVPRQEELSFSEGAEYFYYTANNTIFGTEWDYVPEAPSPIVCDMSSDILSRPVDVSKYGLIYAGAQKNMAPAGLTVVIIDKALAGHALPVTPEIMDYSVLIRTDSLLNTPPCWCIYMLGLVLDWIGENGGTEGMLELRRVRAGKLYDFLDNSTYYIPRAEKGSRSGMNVTFRTPSAEEDAEFVKLAESRGFMNLKGHRVSGGLRASIYNAMPVEGVDALIDFMKEFETAHA